MKKAFAFLLSIGAVEAVLSAEVVSLDGVWQLKTFPQPADGAIRSLPLPAGLGVKSYCASVPGCCEEEVWKAGELPDYLYSTNAFAWRRMEGNQWLYSRSFRAPARRPGERAVLVFEGIDTLADVFLNGKKVGEAENMQIPHEFDVTKAVRTDAENEVSVLIRPVGLAARERVVGEFGMTMSGGTDADAFRKAYYMYGWDIAPRLPVSGLWRGVRFEVRPADRIEDVAWLVTDIDVPGRRAAVGMKCRVVAPFDRLYSAKVRHSLSLRGKVVFSRTEALESFNRREFSKEFGVKDAEFWWPRGLGAPTLYDARVELIAADGRVLAKDERKFGIRTVALEYDDRKLPERLGRFLFRVNGEPVFVRGLDWVPLDPIPSRQSARLPGLLEMVEDLNANLLRVWGGGVYEPDAFYDWCDAHGVLVWQDMMNACSVPPQDLEFQRLMREETLSVVRRLRNHASLALWAGDNENDMARNWHFGRKLARDPNDNVINRQVIPVVLREYDLTRPYLPSSPYVTREAFRGETEPCEDHLWGGERAWWKTPYYVDNACWFCSEGGAHALPCRRTLERVIPAADLLTPWFNPDEPNPRELRWTDQWEYRGTNPTLSRTKYPHNRNLVVLKQVQALFGDVPRRDLDLLIAESQSAQAESIKFQVELFRSQKFVKKGGFVVWNLADVWPTISDAITDYYGERKKAYAAVKEAFRDVLAMVAEDGRILVVNDTASDVRGDVRLVEATDGRMVFEARYTAKANSVCEVGRVSWAGQGLFQIAYTVDGREMRSHYLHGEPPFAWSDYCRWTAK